MSLIEKIDLADVYGNAELDIDSVQFPGRQAAVASVVDSADVVTIKDLAAIVFGLPATNLVDRIVGFVRTADPSFSAKANARELKILAVGALEILTGDDLEWTEGMHAVLALSACGERVCEVDSQIVARMEGRRLQVAVAEANSFPSVSVPIRKLKPSGLPEKLEELLPFLPAANDDTKNALQIVFKALGDAIDVQNASLVTSIRSHLSSVNEKFEHQQDELDLLWWLFGSWSSTLEAPFETFDPPARALLVGVDLGRISNVKAGPAAVSTFAARAIGSYPKSKGTASLKQIVGALDVEQIGKLGLSDLDTSDTAAFPVLGVLKRRHVRDVSADEGSLYSEVEHLDVDKKKPVLLWTKQIYHEMILARNLRSEVEDRA
jgi:hypothetical protein